MKKWAQPNKNEAPLLGQSKGANVHSFEGFML